jgi:two-component system, cell cycle sensor histidine kinase and response regulator CckA
VNELPDTFLRHPLPTWIFDEETLELLAVNDAMVHLYGWSREELLTMTVRELRPVSELPRLEAHVAAGLPHLRGAVLVHHCKDGSQLDVEIITGPIEFAGRRARIVTARDVSEHLRAHQSDRRSLADFHAFIEQMPDGVFTCRAEGAVLYANPAFAKLLGYASAAELVGTRGFDFVAPEDRELVLARIRAIAEPPHSLPPTVIRYVARDGSLRWVETRAIRLTFEDAPAMTVLVRDLTARRSAEEALRRSEERFVKFFHVNPACSTVTRLSDHTFVDVNQRFCDLTGFSRDELIGKTGVSVGLWPDPDQRARIETELHAGGRASEVEVRLCKKSGEPIDVRMSLERFSLGGVDCVFALSYDVTERKQLEAQLRQAQKMDAVGRLAGGIAHDFNNLLTAICGYAEILTTTLAPETRTHDAATHIHRSAQRASALTQQLLVFTRRQPQTTRVVLLNEVVRSMASMLARLLGEDLDLALDLHPELYSVRVDATQIEQVLLNLAVNARDAMPRGGRLTISTANAVDGHGRAGVRLTARDSGCGIDDQTRPHIFEPFFTTKEVGKGTGLGLSIVYGVVTQAGGTIDVDSAPGQGSAFHIWLPRADEPTRPAGAAPATVLVPRAGGETILLVEDDEDVRDYVQFVLRQQGYRVLSADDGDDGLRVVETHDDEIHLVLSDIVMPGMSGPEMAARAQTRRPALKVLHMSGYPGETFTLHNAVAPGTAFLQKPFSVDALTRAVRAALDR